MKIKGAAFQLPAPSLQSPQRLCLIKKICNPPLKASVQYMYSVLYALPTPLINDSFNLSVPLIFLLEQQHTHRAERICVSSHGQESVCAAAVRLVWSFVICIYDDVNTYRWFNMLILTGLFWSSSALSRQYHYINVRMSWPEAQSYCRAKYTDLATVDTMNDVNRLVNIVDSGYSGSVWIGLKRGTQKRWVWSNGEDTLKQYSAWNKKEPSSHNECGYFAFGVWYSYPCSSYLHFVCYNGEFWVVICVNILFILGWELEAYSYFPFFNRKWIHQGTDLEELDRCSELLQTASHRPANNPQLWGTE